MSGPAVTGGTRQDAATMLIGVAERIFGGQPPFRLRAWDGSEAGPAGAPVVTLRSRQALRRMLWHPGELGLAQAYVTGELEVDGDIADGLRAVWRAAENSGLPGARLPAAGWAAAIRAAVALRLPGPPPPRPASQARIFGRLHSRKRDRAVIAHHYDIPAAFYEQILDESMAYSSALWSQETSWSQSQKAPDGGGISLAEAQRAKLDAVCAKLALTRGSTLLDVGCGWGSAAIHAARDYRARVTAVTLSAGQAQFVRQRAAGLGLTGQVEVRACDYRDVTDGRYDAVCSIEMGEHVGEAQYPAFCGLLRNRLRPGGRLLVQQMARGPRAPGGGKFIESYIAPDMHMRPVGQTIAMLEDADLEVIGVQAMRTDYTRTIRAWLANLDRRWDEVSALLGVESARVWRLYLAGGALAFEEGRMSVHQILAVRTGPGPH